MHNLKWCTIFLKQMISKYFLRSLVVALNILLFTSCLGSSDDNFEYSPDAQIYSFSMSSRGDTLNLLNTTAFTIDQVNGKIFNKDPMPYLFHVDSVVLNISSSSTLNPFSQVVLTLSDESDNPFYWSASDSVAINQLLQITTTAPDGKTTKKYDFQLNIFQEDPYVLTWERRDDYLAIPPTDQKTIMLNERFITYYTTGTTVGAASSTDGIDWDNVDELIGLPPTIKLKSLLPSTNAVYVLDESGEVYSSDETGITWSRIPLPYNVEAVEAIYGILPSATSGDILMAVNHNDVLRFAVTNDFSEIQLMNNIPDDMPLFNFTSTSVENPDSYATKYIVLTDGIKKDNTRNEAIWILQEKDEEITNISKVTSASVAGGSLFYYDKRLYLMILTGGKNSFLLSDNFGLDWIEAEDNQSFHSEFSPRTKVSVLADEDNNIWIFGGISLEQVQLIDTWRGRLNKFAMN